MRICFVIFFLFCVNLVNAQNDLALTSEQITQTSAASSTQTWLTVALALRSKKPQESLKLANKVLQTSTLENNPTNSAQAHILLAKLAADEKHNDLSIKHFLLAASIYKQLNEPQPSAKKSLQSIHMLFEQNKTGEINQLIRQLQPIVQLNGFSESFAQTLVAKGAAYYKEKRYQDALEQYTYARQYLTELEPSVQKNLAITYKKMAESYKRLNQREKTVIYYQKTLDIFTQLDDKKNMARTLNTLAEAERYLENYFVALDYSIQGLEIHKQIDDPEGVAKALTGSGVIYRHIGRYEKSLEHIYEAHLYYKKTKKINGIADTSNQMGLIYTRLKQFNLAKTFYQLTIDLPESKILPRTLASATREMAVIHLNDGDYDIAKLMIKKAHKIYQSENNKLSQSLTLRILANIFRAEGDHAKAVYYYRQSLTIARQEVSTTYQIKSLFALGSMLIETDLKEALSLLEESLRLSLEVDNKPYQLYSYRELRIASKRQGNLLESLNFAEKEIAIMKLLQQEREDKKLVLVKANLYSHTKEMELASLKDKAERDQLQLSQKNNEIALANQASIISELELTKNRYANFALVALLVICLTAVIFIFIGFINSRKHNTELKYLASRDPLTNSLNRRALFDLMEQDFVNLTSFDDYCIIMVDIDYFKEVNDTYGHIIGDKVLCEVANILQHCVRETDIVARFGGEEFCIVLPKMTKEQGMLIAETMREKIEASCVQNIKVTCSFGVSSLVFNAKVPETLIEQADLALYQSKQNGRNRVTIWSPEFQL